MKRVTKWFALVITAICASAGQTQAGEMIQTDWCGGDGVPGPVLEFGDRFASQDGVAWLSIAGQLSLAATALPIGREHLINDAYYRSFGIHPADIDGDGDVDVVGTAETSGIVSVWLSDGGSPPILTEQVIDNQYPGADGLWVEDLNGDGRLDVIATGAMAADRIAWWRNGGGDPIQWTRQIIEPDWPNSYEVTAADVDGDHRMDVVSTSWEINCVAWWHNDGGDPIGWTRHLVDETFEGAHSAYGADVDGDGDTDIVGAAALLHEIAWWRNDGGTPIDWVKQTLRTGFDGARSVYPADIDGDGDIDVAGICWDRDLAWWRNDGGDPLEWTEQIVDSQVNGGHSVWAADMNGDGHLDLLGLACNAGFLAWYESDGGDPIVWSRHPVDVTYAAPITVRAGDINSDGALDVLGTSYTWGTFNWWEVTEFVSNGELVSSILDTQQDPAQAAISWEAAEPTGTSVTFQVRCSDNPAAMGDWSSDIPDPGQFPCPPARYVQYRLCLGTEDADLSPILRHVQLSWQIQSGVGEMDGASGLRLLLPNPVVRDGALLLTVPRRAHVDVCLYDIAGRHLARLMQASCGSGAHEIPLPNLAPGVYFCRLQSMGRETCQRLIVVGP